MDSPKTSPTRTVFATTSVLGSINLNDRSIDRRASPVLTTASSSSSTSSSSSSSTIPRTRNVPPLLQLGAAAFVARPRSNITIDPVASTSSIPENDSNAPALVVQPASPAIQNDMTRTPSSIRASAPQFAAKSLPKGFAPPPIGPTSPGGLAARRMLNKKRLSLLVPGSSNASTSMNPPLSPLSPTISMSLGQLSLPGTTEELDSATRSLPPTPGVSLQSFIGPEGAEEEDRTIGRLMMADRLAMKLQADEMREQMRGGRNMKRRTSIPRLNLERSVSAGGMVGGLPSLVVPKGMGSAPSSSMGSGNSPKRPGMGSGSKSFGSAVQLIRSDNIERGGLDGDNGQAGEEFPYALGPREIVPGVFLGSEQNARDPHVLAKWGFGYVLNVAKEVECPWVDDKISVEAKPSRRASAASVKFVTPPTATKPLPESPSETGEGHDATIPLPPTTKHSHRRTKTQGVIALPENLVATRAHFVRPTASTPNLQSAFNSAFVSPPTAEVPILSKEAGASPDDLTASTLRRSSLRPKRDSIVENAVAPDGSVKFLANAETGRPQIDYLWLKWGHDESDLVEARKFQAAFDFLDKARADQRGQGRVLVHCQCGVSRSATVVIAYCMREAARALEQGQEIAELAGCTGMHDTYSFVKEKSEWVGPNLGLVFQLVGYERALRGDSIADRGEEEEEPPFPDYAAERAAAEAQFAEVSNTSTSSSSQRSELSPRTPISSRGSTASGSNISTPETSDSYSLLSIGSSSKAAVTSSPLSIQIETPSTATATSGLESRHERINGDDPYHQEATARSHNQESTFILPPPPRANGRSANGRPLGLTLNLDAARKVAATGSKPKLTVSTPLSAKSPTPIGPPQTNGTSLLTGMLNKFAFPGSTNTSSTMAPPADPRSPEVNSPYPHSSSSSSTLSSLTEDGTSTPSLVTETAALMTPASVSSSSSSMTGKRPSFGGSQTPSERRMSHKRVFSDVPPLPYLLKSKSLEEADGLIQ